MSYKLLIILNAVVVLALGLALLVVPDMALDQFKMDARVTEVFLVRVLGAALTSLGLFLWFSKDADATAQKSLGISALIGVVLALIVTVMGVATDIIRVNGWIALIVEVVFGLGYAFLLFLKPKMKE